jgi:hypothetical protein
MASTVVGDSSEASSSKYPKRLPPTSETDSQVGNFENNEVMLSSQELTPQETLFTGLGGGNLRTEGSPPPAPPRPSSKPEEEDCSICQSSFSSRSTLQPCGHKFDFRCIMTWLEEVFRSKNNASELNCPLCRQRISTILEEGASQPFDVVNHFGGLARRQHTPGYLTATLNQLDDEFHYGGNLIGQAGPSSIHSWNQESVALYGPRRQFLIHPWQSTYQNALAALFEETRLLQDLEDMGEGASTDLDYVGNSASRLRRVGMEPPRPFSRQMCWWCYQPHHTGQRAPLCAPASTEDRLQRFREPELYGRPWRRTLQERRELQRGQELFSERIRRAESELMVESVSGGPSSNYIREEQSPGVSRKGTVSTLQHSSTNVLSAESNYTQPSTDNRSLSYERQLENMDSTIFAELPEWMKEELRWEVEAIKAAKL